MTGMDKDNQKPMVHVEHLKKYFPVRKKGILKAVDDVSFDICAGETLGLSLIHILALCLATVMAASLTACGSSKTSTPDH